MQHGAVWGKQVLLHSRQLDNNCAQLMQQSALRVIQWLTHSVQGVIFVRTW